MPPKFRLMLAIASAIAASTISLTQAQSDPASDAPIVIPPEGAFFPPGNKPPLKAAPSAVPIEAGTQKVRLTLSDLRTVGLDLKNGIKNLTSLYEEVTVQPMQVITEPDIIGQATIISVPIGTRPIGPIEPAKPERVNLCMNTIKPHIAMLKTNVDAFLAGEKELDMPASIRAEMQPDLQVWVTTVQSLATQETKLEELTAKSPYDQPTIASTCLDMQVAMKTLDEKRRSMYHILKKHAKELNISQL